MVKGILRPLTLVAALAGFLALPAASHAGYQTFGSDLSSPANMTETHGADSAFWSTSLANGSNPAVPALGQVTEVRLKGTVTPNMTPGAPAPLNEVHIQVLRPQPDGSVRVELSSQPFYVPVGGDPNQVSTWQPINLCAQAGDYIAFNDEGGFDPNYYPSGVPFQVFGRVPGSTTQFYTADNGTKNGAVFKGTPHHGQELLMQMTLATGKDATPICPRGPIANDDFPGVSIQDQVAVVNPEGGHTRVRTTCPAGIRVHCTGPMTLTSVASGPTAAQSRAAARRKKARKKACKKARKRYKLAKRSTAVVRKLKKARKKACKKAKKAPGKVPGGIKLGRNDRFWLDPGLTRDVRVPLTKQALALIKKNRSVKAVVTADVTDGAGQPQVTRASVTIKAPKSWR
jgi:hypothetical protein